MPKVRGILVQGAQSMRLLLGTSGSVQSYELSLPLQASNIDEIVDWISTTVQGKLQLIIAPSATATLVASIPIGSLGEAVKRVKPGSHDYLLEEYLPWSAEDFTARILPSENHLLGLALRTSEWKTFCDALRNSGHQVLAMVPAALIEFEGLKSRVSSQANEFLIRNREGFHFIDERCGHLEDWRFWPLCSDELTIEVCNTIASELAFISDSHAIGIPSKELQLIEATELRGIYSEPFDVDEQSEDELIWSGAQRIWKRSQHSCDLLTGQLAGTATIDVAVGSTKLLLNSIIVVLLVASAAFLWKAFQLNDVSAEIQRDHVDLYKETFPGSSVPLAIASRFESQYRTLVKQRHSAGDVGFPEPILTSLQQILSAHQAPIRSQFREIEIADGQVEIECEFRNRQDASQMVKRLEELGLHVETPQLQTLDGERIGTRLRGRLGAE